MLQPLSTHFAEEISKSFRDIISAILCNDQVRNRFLCCNITQESIDFIVWKECFALASLLPEPTASSVTEFALRVLRAETCSSNDGWFSAAQEAINVISVSDHPSNSILLDVIKFWLVKALTDDSPDLAKAMFCFGHISLKLLSSTQSMESFLKARLKIKSEESSEKEDQLSKDLGSAASDEHDIEILRDVTEKEIFSETSAFSLCLRLAVGICSRLNSCEVN